MIIHIDHTKKKKKLELWQTTSRLTWERERVSFGRGRGRWGGACHVLEEVVVGVASAGDLADLGVPCELGVVAVEGPEAVGTEGEAPHLLGLLAPLLHAVDVLPLLPIPLLRILHQPQHQILRKLHDETHLSLSLSLNHPQPNQPPTFFFFFKLSLLHLPSLVFRFGSGPQNLKRSVVIEPSSSWTNFVINIILCWYF